MAAIYLVIYSFSLPFDCRCLNNDNNNNSRRRHLSCERAGGRPICCRMKNAALAMCCSARHISHWRARQPRVGAAIVSGHDEYTLLGPEEEEEEEEEVLSRSDRRPISRASDLRHVRRPAADRAGWSARQ